MPTETSSTAYFGGHLISHITNPSFSGSSSPMQDTFPRAKGVLLRPSGVAERRLSAKCVWFGSGFSKTQIEGFQHSLIEQAAKSDTADLTINDNTYQDVFISGLTFDNIVHNERLEFNVEFTLPNESYFVDALIDGAITRPATFDYSYRKNSTEEGSFQFGFYNNFEAANSVSFDEFKNISLF
jgi:hypothetical protein